MLEDLKSNNKVIGLKQSLKALEKDSVKTIFIAKDADEKVIRNVKEISQKNTVETVYVENMKVLGKACNIEVGASVVCILK